MTQPPAGIFWTEAIRARRSPGRKVNLFLLYCIPILNILALAALGSAVSGRLVTAPAIRFDLPEAEFRSGAEASLSAALAVPPNGTTPLLFLDGIRYRIGDEAEADALAEALNHAMGGSGRHEITLYADGAAPYATMMRFASVARRAGARAVNLAIREAEAK